MWIVTYTCGLTTPKLFPPSLLSRCTDIVRPDWPGIMPGPMVVQKGNQTWALVTLLYTYSEMNISISHLVCFSMIFVCTRIRLNGHLTNAVNLAMLKTVTEETAAVHSHSLGPV
jgi:hypothetical protein